MTPRWKAVALSVIAALALPVVGLITGRVVGDFFLRGDVIGMVGASFGVLVYALALASSYSHLRHYYRGYEAQGVRASRALALAVEGDRLKKLWCMGLLVKEGSKYRRQ